MRRGTSAARRFAGRTVLITGAASGIGKAVALRFAREGAAVAINYHDTESEAQSALAEIDAAARQSGVDADENLAVAADVSSETDVKALFAEILGRWGRLDILVNNAGITRDGTLHRMSFEQWNSVIQTNLSSCFNMCRCVIEGMRERGFGRLVNIGSVNGQAGQYGQVNYAASKSGIHGFTKALAQEGAAKGVTVNAIAPGYIDTDMVRAVPERVLEKIISGIPVGRLGHADEIARGVLFLVADEAGFVTGSTMSINGGQHMY